MNHDILFALVIAAIIVAMCLTAKMALSRDQE